jgi:hypothetical protein
MDELIKKFEFTSFERYLKEWMIKQV